MNRLFVYGTLMPSRRVGRGRDGVSNPAEMLDGASEVVTASTAGRLYHLRFGYPALIDLDEGEVFGELVTIGDLESRLAALDRYEGDLYRRVQRDVDVGGKEIVKAWCYVVDASEEARLVADGAIRLLDGRWTGA